MQSTMCPGAWRSDLWGGGDSGEAGLGAWGPGVLPLPREAAGVSARPAPAPLAEFEREAPEQR